GLRAAVDALGFDDVTVVGFAGDGGTTDIGLQALSGMLERGTDAIFAMYDNEAYMNTGIQRSGATPQGAWTTTTPVGPTARGKAERPKDIMAIVLAHHPVYAATLNPSFPEDFVRKVEKAKVARGPRFLHIFSPCPPGWRFSSEAMIELGRLATDSGIFPLYEVDADGLRLTRRIGELKPVHDYLALQGRFAHLTAEEIERIEATVRSEWTRLLERDAQRAVKGAASSVPTALSTLRREART
ncbi:MAG: thiamine pyrophosphate-dependent enzyme, partial [Thermoplasmata archaeon]